jgi:hypothetical protein
MNLFRLLLITLLIFSSKDLTAQQTTDQQNIPFSTDSTHITVWNGESYHPLFIKGINLGVAVPGTFPGQMAATSEDYARWFQMIRDAGFNTIRLYTLHFPRFYEELRKFNLENPNHPLLIFQGVWLEEEVAGYTNDLYTLTDQFEQEIRFNIDAVHGNGVIPELPGKAYGTYTADVSRWNIGYIIGREVHPPEILTTNQIHASITGYEGDYFSIEDTHASEAWMTARFDYLVSYEMENYNTQRPVSFSSWPTLDPLTHPVTGGGYEDSASVDLSTLTAHDSGAGFFISYHAYPYYPDYISREPRYTSFFDHLGQNSYLGYLTYLKEHYQHIPLIIAEIGGPSSWGTAKFAHNGIHHGGYDERTQGENNIRLMRNIVSAGAGGGIQFSWMDEWFKRTWITDPIDFDTDRRVLWHNVSAAEQNYGLIGYRKENHEPQLWETFCDGCPVESISASADFSYLRLRLNTTAHLAIDDTIWVSLDTYDADLGESVLPSGHVVENRAEFALMITNNKAELFVTQAYDLFGIWHGTSSPEQLYRSVVTDEAPWYLVRWKNNDPDNEVQFIGSLQVNRLNMPTSSLDGVRLFDDRIDIRLPWSLINFTDPSEARVMHDNRNSPETETRISDGISVGIFYNDFEIETSERFLWEPWTNTHKAIEYKKASYDVIKENLITLPGNPIAVTNSYNVSVDQVNHISVEEGVLINDLSLDGTSLSAVLDKTPRYGMVNLEPDGSFTYMPESGRTGTDSFTYRARAGNHLSEPATIELNIGGTPVGSGFVSLYPNPSTGDFTIRSSATIDHIEIYTVIGQLLYRNNINNREASISLHGYTPGVYYVRVHSGDESQIKKMMLIR